MTYIQITTRCNMSCEHCGMNCTKRGHDMSKAVWNRALEFSKRYDTSVAIGGGEPTLHKYFREFLLDVIALEYCESRFIATNGSIKKHALLLAKLAKAGIIAAALSQDPWHDEIDQEVIDAFTRDDSEVWDRKNVDDYREIRNVEESVIAAGRAIENELYVHDNQCICEGWFIDPHGNLKPCGCEDAPIICNIMETPWETLETIISDLDDDGELGQECWKNCENLKVDSETVSV